jgi:hypothetical protein
MNTAVLPAVRSQWTIGSIGSGETDPAPAVCNLCLRREISSDSRAGILGLYNAESNARSGFTGPGVFCQMFPLCKRFYRRGASAVPLSTDWPRIKPGRPLLSPGTPFGAPLKHFE